MDRGNQNINDNINDNSRDQGSEGSMGVNTYQKNTFNDDVFYGLARRAERIATALYMVSNFISKDAVLRKDMRRHWMRVVKDLYKCMICDAYDQQFYLEEALVSIEYVASTLRIATATGSISEMNKNILDKAMISLGGQIKVQLQIALRYEQDFSRDVAPAIDKDTLLGFLQETVDSDSVANTEFQQALQEAISVKKTFKTTQNDKYLKRQTKRQVVVKSSNGSAHDRREKIRAIITDKGEATIKDIATRITNCSEKTLQRDLAKLIKDNIIEKEGDKRWSIYRIKDNT